MLSKLPDSPHTKQNFTAFVSATWKHTTGLKSVQLICEQTDQLDTE